MRVLIWSDGFWPEIGGVSTFCLHLVTELQRRGHDCRIITNQLTAVDPDLNHYRQMPIHRFPFHAALAANDLPAMRAHGEAAGRIIDDFQPEVIHSHVYGRSSFFLLRQLKRRPVPSLLTLHDNTLFLHRNGLSAALLQNVDALAAISQSIRGEALDCNPHLETKLHLVLNALPPPKLEPTPLPLESKILIFGRLVRDKGFDLAIEAFARVATEFPGATLTVAGNGECHDHLQAQAADSGFADRIHFLGWVAADAIPDLLNQHALVIMPSRWKEPFGLVALQTAQMGRPIIASKTGGIPEIVTDGVTGLLFENENLEGLTAALRLMLERPRLRESLGHQARRDALSRFDFSRMVTAYEDLYRDLQTGNKS